MLPTNPQTGRTVDCLYVKQQTELAMNKGATIVLVVVVAAISFAAGYFVDDQLHRDREATALQEMAKLKTDLNAARAERDEFARESNPKLWWDNSAAEVIKELGYDYVYVVRWRNAIADGWVEFDEADGPKRFPIDGSKRLFDQLSNTGQMPVAKGSYGNVILALRQIGQSDEFDCQVSGKYLVTTDKGVGTGISESKKAKVKLEIPENKGARHFGPQHTASGFFAASF